MANINDLQLRFLWDQTATTVNVDGSTIKSSDIVFLPQKNQIYVNGVYFGLTDELKTRIENAITNLGTAQTDISGLTTRVGTLETNVGSTSALTKSLALAANSLQAAIDGGEVYRIGEGTAPTATQLGAWASGDSNIYAALNHLHELVDATNQAAGVTSVKNATGDESIIITSGGANGTGAITLSTNASKIKTVTAIAKDANGRGVNIDAGATVEGALGTINTALQGVQGDIATAATAAGAAQTSADGKISKSLDDTTVRTLSGAQGSALTTATAIADAIEAAYGKLLGTQTDFTESESKTLGQLRTLIKGLRSDVASLQTAVSGMDPDSTAKITKIINELKQIGDNDEGDFANTILDRLTPFLAYASTYDSQGTEGAQGGYYKVSKLDGTQSYVNNVQGLIDALSAEIVAARNAGVGAGVTSLNSKTGAVTIANGTGTTVADSNGNIVINASSAATTTAALTQSQSGYGATTASGSTIQTALQDINNAASNAGKSAASAGEAASAAQTDATNALNQLKWVVVTSSSQNP